MSRLVVALYAFAGIIERSMLSIRIFKELALEDDIERFPFINRFKIRNLVSHLVSLFPKFHSVL